MTHQHTKPTLTWRTLITDAMVDHNETITDLIDCTISDEELGAPISIFNVIMPGKRFTAWTKKTVYIPVSFNLIPFVIGIPRHPNVAEEEPEKPIGEQVREYLSNTGMSIHYYQGAVDASYRDCVTIEQSLGVERIRLRYPIDTLNQLVKRILDMP